MNYFGLWVLCFSLGLRLYWLCCLLGFVFGVSVYDFDCLFCFVLGTLVALWFLCFMLVLVDLPWFVFMVAMIAMFCLFVYYMMGLGFKFNWICLLMIWWVNILIGLPFRLVGWLLFGFGFALLVLIYYFEWFDFILLCCWFNSLPFTFGVWLLRRFEFVV